MSLSKDAGLEQDRAGADPIRNMDGYLNTLEREVLPVGRR